MCARPGTWKGNLVKTTREPTYSPSPVPFETDSLMQWCIIQGPHTTNVNALSQLGVDVPHAAHMHTCQARRVFESWHWRGEPEIVPFQCARMALRVPNHRVVFVEFRSCLQRPAPQRKKCLLWTWYCRMTLKPCGHVPRKDSNQNGWQGAKSFGKMQKALRKAGIWAEHFLTPPLCQVRPWRAVCDHSDDHGSIYYCHVSRLQAHARSTGWSVAMALQDLITHNRPSPKVRNNLRLRNTDTSPSAFYSHRRAFSNAISQTWYTCSIRLTISCFHLSHVWILDMLVFFYMTIRKCSISCWYSHLPDGPYQKFQKPRLHRRDFIINHCWKIPYQPELLASQVCKWWVWHAMKFAHIRSRIVDKVY